MAANITPSFVSAGGSRELMRSPRGYEMVKLVGSSTSAGDTSTAYTCQNIQNPAFVIGGAFSATYSGATVTFKSLIALNSETVYVWVADAI